MNIYDFYELKSEKEYLNLSIESTSNELNTLDGFVKSVDRLSSKDISLENLYAKFSTEGNIKDKLDSIWKKIKDFFFKLKLFFVNIFRKILRLFYKDKDKFYSKINEKFEKQYDKYFEKNQKMVINMILRTTVYTFEDEPLKSLNNVELEKLKEIEERYRKALVAIEKKMSEISYIADNGKTEDGRPYHSGSFDTDKETLGYIAHYDYDKIGVEELSKLFIDNGKFSRNRAVLLFISRNAFFSEDYLYNAYEKSGKFAKQILDSQTSLTSLIDKMRNDEKDVEKYKTAVKLFDTLTKITKISLDSCATGLKCVFKFYSGVVKLTKMAHAGGNSDVNYRAPDSR